MTKELHSLIELKEEEPRERTAKRGRERGGRNKETKDVQDQMFSWGERKMKKRRKHSKINAMGEPLE